jgi:hypothetical protein
VAGSEAGQAEALIRKFSRLNSKLKSKPTTTEVIDDSG